MIHLWESSSLASSDINIAGKITHAHTYLPKFSVESLQIRDLNVIYFPRGAWQGFCLVCFYVRLWRRWAPTDTASFILCLKWPPLYLSWWAISRTHAVKMNLGLLLKEDNESSWYKYELWIHPKRIVSESFPELVKWELWCINISISVKHPWLNSLQ